MPNTIAYNQVMTEELDKALVQRSVTGFMADNNLRAKFIGAKTVLIPEVDTQGLGDYDRAKGFVSGTVTVANTPYVLGQDRGRSFQVDAQDADESGISDLMGKMMGEFVRTKVIPEMDAYVLSKVAGLAVTRNQTVAGAPASEIYRMLAEAFNKVRDAAGYDEELVCIVNSTVQAALESSSDLQRRLVLNDFKKGELTSKVQCLNGVPILPASDARMKTAYEFYDGTTSGQEAGGFVPATNAKSIGFLVMPKKAAMLVKKTEQVRNFTPAQNLNADAWKSDYRVYYDVFTKNSYLPTIYAYTY